MFEKNSYTLICFLLVAPFLYSQESLEELQSLKSKLQNEISASSEKLKSFEIDISDLSVKITAQRINIKNLNQLIDKQNRIISINAKLVSKYTNQIDILRKKKEVLSSDYRNKINRIYVNALLNLNKFNIFNFNINKNLKKRVYTAQYYNSCKSQAESILINIETAEKTKNELALIQKENDIKTRELSTKKNALTTLIDADKKLSKSLKSKRKSIEKQVKSKNKKLKDLGKSIRKLIKNTSKGKPSDILLSNQFEANKGIYPAPLINGVVISQFGEQSHPISKNVKIFNNGVDILSNQSNVVTAIFDGVIMSIQSVPGLNKVVILKHGAYFTVYANLSKTFKKIGDAIKTGDRLGEISLEPDRRVLHFELWKNQKQVNPVNWIDF